MRSTRLTASLATAISVVAFAAACGGGTDDQATPAASAAGNGMTAFVDCLKGQGIELPAGFGQGGPGGLRGSGFPTSRPSGFPTSRPSGFPTARPSGFPTVRPSGGVRPGGTARPGGGFGNQVPAGVDAEKWQAAMTACASVRPAGGGFGASRRPGGGDNGANAAYANCLGEHGATFTPGQDLATSDPKIAEAVKACAPLKPAS